MAKENDLIDDNLFDEENEDTQKRQIFYLPCG